MIVTVGKGKITLSGAANLSAVRIKGKNSNPLVVGLERDKTSISSTLDNATIQAVGGNATINNRGANVFIDGDIGGNKIINYGKNTLINVGDRSVHVYSCNSYQKADNDYLNNYVENRGSFTTILGSAGGSEVNRSSESHVVLVGAESRGKDSIYNFATNVFIDAYSGKDYICNYSAASNVTIDGGYDDDTIYNEYASNVTINGGAGNDTIRNWLGNNVSIKGETGDDFIYIVANNKNGNNITIDGGKGDDFITLSSVSKNDLIAYSLGDGKDTISGFNSTSTLQIDGTYSTEVDGDNIVVTVDDGSILLVGAATVGTVQINSEQIFADGAKSKITLASGIEIGDAASRTTAIKIVGNVLHNSILGGSGKDTLYGYYGKDYLVGNAGNDKLYGQNGDDTLWGGTGNDTLTGGNGADVFIYSAGNDVIADYAAGDKISISAAISKSSVKGSDATFTIGKSTLTVTKGKGAEIAFIDADGNERTIIGGAYISDDTTTSNVKMSIAWREVVDATARTKAVKVTGNANNNSILGGSGNDSLYGNDGNDYLVGNAGNDKLYGQNGDDTLWGGIGNDTLTGGSGADTFIYNSGEGKDVIADFADDDLLQISDGFTATYNASANTIAFKIASTASAITLKNFTATTFNINGDSYAISGKNLVKQ